MTAANHHPSITVMAFDFGTQKIGVAVGQSLTLTASPLAEIRARQGQPDWDQVAKLIEEWQPDAFVVGVPLNMDGSEFDLTLRARKFGQRLHGRFGKPWHEMDERLTSFEAREKSQIQHKQKTSRSSKTQLVDSVAASLILQSWFAERWPLLANDQLLRK